MRGSGNLGLVNRDVVHKDQAPRNWSFNPEIDKVVFFDFERAEVIEPRPVLGMISSNRKRKRIRRGSVDKKPSSTEFAEEINKANAVLSYTAAGSGEPPII